MRILIIEDEELIANRINASCVENGFICHVANNGIDSIHMIKTYEYDVVILDLMLPDITGFSVLEEIKRSRSSVSVIVLSGLNSTDDKVKCLACGADDYVTKPFSKTELLARIYAVFRRSNGLRSSVIKVGPISLDFTNKIVKIYETEIELTAKEYATLELLILRRGAIITKEMFLNYMYCGLDEPDFKIVDVFVCKLRRKMAEASGGTNFIETVWGRGYTIKEYPEEINTDSVRKLMAS
jgi:two-component system cell cycle response regulator CtrA